MKMQADWVDAIFARLTLAYGLRFMQQYGDLQPEHVKASWASELGGITSGGVAHALAHLPTDYPPNAMQFRNLCQRLPTPMAKALPAPRASDASVRRFNEAVAPLKRQKDPKQWAHVLRAEEAAGGRLSIAQRTMWRAALGNTKATDSNEE